MLHELLFALNGHHGRIFTLRGDRFRVNDTLPFFHPAEKEILNQLLDVATDVWKITNFITANRNAAWRKVGDKDGLCGIYVEALCEGLNQVLLGYRNTLVHLEKVILKEGDARLSHFQHKIMPFQPVVRSLCGLINLIMLRRSHGCAILDVVYRASCSGVDKVREALQRILQECHKVFYKHLLSWILQGNLYDPHQEFIIGCVEEVPSLDVAPEERSKLTEKSWLIHDDPKPNKKFVLKVELLPCHISVAVAEKIFFIGESIQLFERERKLESHGAVLKDKEEDFYNQLAELRDSPEFRVADFERFVDCVRETASRHLHDLVLQSSDLKSELDMLRSFFLLARGELFQAFIEEAQIYLQLPPTPSTQHDVGQAFQNACRRLHHDDESIFKKVRVRIVVPATKNIKLTGWDCLALDYQVPWPLHLIISPEVIEKYNSIFRFLLTVKRTQLKLHETWAKQMRTNKSSIRMNEEWQLRTHMTFVVDNLQHYLMADVLESQFSVLIHKLGCSTNFEELRHGHEVFLTSITAHTFINNKPVHQCLSELLSACLKYCDLMENDPEEKAAILSALSLNFSQHSGLLFKLLTSIRSRQTGSQLAQLLLRIDYNRYFSTHGHAIGTVL